MTVTDTMASHGQTCCGTMDLGTPALGAPALGTPALGARSLALSPPFPDDGRGAGRLQPGQGYAWCKARVSLGRAGTGKADGECLMGACAVSPLSAAAGE